MKYADPRGQVLQQTFNANNEQELRDRYAAQGYLVYWVKPRAGALRTGLFGGTRKLNVERFLIFNQQFVTLIRAGLPILKSLDLLADRLADPSLVRYIKAVRDEVKNGTQLSDAFRMQGIFPKIYVTTVMAGEKAGSLVDVLDRFITYQKLALSVRKKVLVSLMYPSVLISLTLLLIVFLVTYVVPNFAELYKNMSAELPAMTQVLIAVGTTARAYIILAVAAILGTVVMLRLWLRTDAGKEAWDRVLMRLPVVGDIWTKYQVAQFSRVLSTLLTGGIPLVQGLDTAAESLGTMVLRRALDKAGKLVREGQPLSASLSSTKIFPPLAVDMIEVGESTGALPTMLTSVAEFYEEDVNTRMAAALSLIEPAIMIFMGMFVAFVLV
ncbi:MAG: type II secretion system F family protein, partial [Bryobacteraceae bacterium]